MSLLKKYVEYEMLGDASKIASLFTEDGYFHDEGLVKRGGKLVKLKGRKAIEAFFTQVLSQTDFKISNVCINGNAMRYDAQLGDQVFLALGVMKEENNMIKEYVVKVV
ncbi:hypothetical protein ACFL9T_02275 [Thermodesulfobacteriota bacterium]